MRRSSPRGIARLLRAASAWLLMLLAWVATLPGFLLGAVAETGERPAPAAAVVRGSAGAPEAGDPAGARRAWLDGRAAAERTTSGRDRSKVQRAVRGSGATTATPAAWIVPAGADPTIPPLALGAYRNAASWASGFDPGCRLSWSVLAGIGRIESNHGRHAGAAARLRPNGDVAPPILGPVLDGLGVAAIRDTDGGRLDGNTTWDRAVGPMQFLPSTWRALGRDGNGDGVADPENFFDATVSAAAYLCLGGGGDLSDPARLRAAVYGYNHSWPYVDAVLGWAAFYARAIGGGPGVLPPQPPASTPPTTSTTLPTTTGHPATTAPPATAPRGTSTTTRAPATTRATATTTTTGPATTTKPATTTTRAATATTAPAATTTTPCTPPTTTTLPPGSATTTTTTTTTLPGGSATTTTTLPPCRPSSAAGTTAP